MSHYFGYFSNFNPGRRESLSVENSNKITEHDSDGTAEPNAIELPQDPQILTINVLPEAKHTDAPQGQTKLVCAYISVHCCSNQYHELFCYLKDIKMAWYEFFFSKLSRK